MYGVTLSTEHKAAAEAVLIEEISESQVVKE